MRKTVSKSDRLRWLDVAFAGMNRHEITALIKESPHAWVFGEPATPDAPNARRALSDACGKHKCHNPEYKFGSFGPPGRQQYVCVASVKIPTHPNVFTVITSREMIGNSKKAAAEIAAAEALDKLNGHFVWNPRNN